MYKSYPLFGNKLLTERTMRMTKLRFSYVFFYKISKNRRSQKQYVFDTSQVENEFGRTIFCVDTNLSIIMEIIYIAENIF